MPRIKAVTDAGGVKFYPSSITHAIYDVERNQKLTATLDDFSAAINNKADVDTVDALVEERVDSSELAAAIAAKIVSMNIDPVTGLVSLVLDDGKTNN